MARYYFFGSLLPALDPDQKPELSWAQFIDLAEQNLAAHDWDRLAQLRTWFDLLNLRPLWEERPLSPYGNYDQEGLQTALVTQSGLPPSVWDYLADLKTSAQRLARLPQLLLSYLTEQASSPGFLGWYARHEKERRLLFVALRALQQGEDAAQVLAALDAEDPFVGELIRLGGGPRLSPPFGWAPLVHAWENYADAPMEMAETLLAVQLRQIAEESEVERFTIDHVLSYAVRLVAVEQIRSLPEYAGRAQLQQWLASMPQR